MAEEVWVPVTNYEDIYQVSDFGRLRVGGRVLATAVNCHGYVKAQLVKNGVSKHTTMHRVVAHAFLGSPFRTMQVNHKDFDKANNRVENLEWTTAAENVQHAVAGGVFASMGSKHYKAKLDDAMVVAIRDARVKGVPLKELSRDYGVSMSTISAAASGRTWRSV